MNTIPEVVEVTGNDSLLDFILMAGWTGRTLVVLMLGLLILGIILIKKKPSPSVRWGYTMAASLPVLIGFIGTSTALISEFAVRGSKLASDRTYIYVIMGKAFLPLAIGLFGAAVVMTLAFFVWMRSMKPAG